MPFDIQPLTIEGLTDTVHKLKQLRMLLGELEPDEYDHSQYVYECNSPSCALGWATTIWPENLEIQHGDVFLRGTATGNSEAASEFFGLSLQLADYIFQFNVQCRFGAKHCCLDREDDDSVETTIQRINRLEAYLRRKLAILIAEQETPEKSYIQAAKHLQITQ